MTDEELQAIEVRAAVLGSSPEWSGDIARCIIADGKLSPEATLFATAALMDVRALLAEVSRLRALLREARGYVDDRPHPELVARINAALGEEWPDPNRFDQETRPVRQPVDYGGGATGSRSRSGSVPIEMPPGCTRGSIAEFEACAAEGHTRCREDAER